MASAWQREGTIAFVLSEAGSAWRNDGKRQDLPELRVNRFRVGLCKTESGSLQVRLLGLAEVPIVLEAPLPASEEPVCVILIWRNGMVELLFNSEPAAFAPVPTDGEINRARDN